MQNKITSLMAEAEAKAWEALSGYKFWMFGYHAGRWINYNRLLEKQMRNPFAEAVKLARRKIEEREQCLLEFELKPSPIHAQPIVKDVGERDSNGFK